MFARIFLLLAISQIYWIWRGTRFLRRKIPDSRVRLTVGVLAAAVYVAFYLANFGPLEPPRIPSPIHLTPYDALISAPALWWIAASMVGFLLVLIFELVVRAPLRLVRHCTRPKIDTGRREFLGRTATAVASAPFVAGAYGLLYGRLNLETTAQPVRLARLPGAFHGFRIAQISDIHIGPFMPQEEIRKYAAIANALKPDLIVLTGDFVTFDPSTQDAVVDALSGLRAPFGVFGCLGNHDAWSGVEDSISLLFRQRGIRILRSERVAIESHGERINLIGTDFQSPRAFGPSPAVVDLLGDVRPLIQADQVNILLSHNPDTFNRAAEMNIDLSLAGHTHGGQAALEFISPELAPSRLVTPYVAGLFQRPGGQLYVNRGIGTIFIPIRIGAPPEISVFELLRAWAPAIFTPGRRP